MGELHPEFKTELADAIREYGSAEFKRGRTSVLCDMQPGSWIQTQQKTSRRKKSLERLARLYRLLGINESEAA